MEVEFNIFKMCETCHQSFFQHQNDPPALKPCGECSELICFSCVITCESCCTSLCYNCTTSPFQAFELMVEDEVFVHYTTKDLFYAPKLSKAEMCADCASEIAGGVKDILPVIRLLDNICRFVVSATEFHN
jgi:hypothetical protein